jgi:GNAT superfamily N-acetyltransferase
MAVTEVRLGPQQLGGCVALSAAAGWNQNAADWRLMLELGEGWGLALADGTLVASTLVLPYGAFAWISMVLVLPGHRRQGHATRLLGVALDHLEKVGLVAILDATPAGRDVYRRHDFRDCWTFKRYVMHRRTDPGQIPVRPLRESDWPWIRELDRAAFGGDRERLLRALASRLPAAALVVERAGYVLGRDGREVSQLGPLVANNPDVARSLLAGALARVTLPLYLDIADHAVLDRDGLALERPFMRMVRGAARSPGDESRVYMVAGPELG